MRKNSLFVFVGLLILSLCIVSACDGGGGGPTTTAPTTAITGIPPTETVTTTSAQTTTPPTTTSSTSNLSDILGKGANIDSVKYDMVMTGPQIGEIKATIWQKQNKMREEMTIEGMTMIILFDMDENIMYTYMPDQNMATKTTLDSSMIPQGSAEDIDAIMDYDPNIVGTESIDGKVCTVITFDIPGTGSVTEWIWEAEGFPLKMEITSSEGTITIENENIDFSDIPDSTFELPAGVEIIAM